MKAVYLKALPAAAFLLLIIFPESAAEGARTGLGTCAEIIIPSLFPFFIASGLISGTGTGLMLGRALSGILGRAAGFSETASAAFAVGITGGYPMGAKFLADELSRGHIAEEEAEAVLPYVNNSGPAFILGAVGVGAFGSAETGVRLYIIHICSALLCAAIFNRHSRFPRSFSASECEESFAELFCGSVKGAAAAMLQVCGFVVCFSVLLSILKDPIFSLSGASAALLGLEPHFTSAVLSGFFELGNAVSCLRGLSTSRLNLAHASFILSFGGLSVLMQTLAVLKTAKAARYILGRLCIALISAMISLIVF